MPSHDGLCSANAKIALGNSWEQQGGRAAHLASDNHSASLRRINRRDGGREKGGFEAEVDVGGNV